MIARKIENPKYQKESKQIREALTFGFKKQTQSYEQTHVNIEAPLTRNIVHVYTCISKPTLNAYERKLQSVKNSYNKIIGLGK